MRRAKASGLVAGSPSGKDAHGTREAVGRPIAAAEHLKQAPIDSAEVDWVGFDVGQVLRRCFGKLPTATAVN